MSCRRYFTLEYNKYYKEDILVILRESSGGNNKIVNEFSCTCSEITSTNNEFYYHNSNL